MKSLFALMALFFIGNSAFAQEANYNQERTVVRMNPVDLKPEIKAEIKNHYGSKVEVIIQNKGFTSQCSGKVRVALSDGSTWGIPFSVSVPNGQTSVDIKWYNAGSSYYSATSATFLRFNCRSSF